MAVVGNKRILDQLPSMVFFAVAAPLLCWFFYDGVWGQLVTYGAGSDIWEHVAVVKAWSENILHPSHPHMNVDAGSPRFTPLYLIYALIVALTGLPPLQVVGWAGVLHVIVFVLGLRWFAQVYYRSAWAPVFALIIMLTFWGMGWGWSNAYGLRSLILVASYPSIGTFALSFVLFGLVVSSIRQEKPLSLLRGFVIAALVFTIVLSHPLTAIFSGVFVLALLWFERHQALNHEAQDNVRRILVYGALACAVAFMWPWFSLAGLLFRDDLGWQVNWFKFVSVLDLDRVAAINTVGRRQYFYNFDQLMHRGGVGLICFLSIFVVWRYMSRYRAIVAVAGVFVGLWGLNAVLPLALGHRYFFFALVAAHLALVCLYVEAVRYEHKWLRLGFVIGAFLSLSVFAVMKVDKTFTGYVRKVDFSFDRQASVSPVVRRNQEFARHLTESAVVATDLTTAFSLPAFIGKVVIAKRGNNYVKNIGKRRRDLKTILAAKTPDSTRIALLNAYQATHVIVTKRNTSPALIAFCQKNSVAVYQVGDDRICELEISLGTRDLKKGNGA